MTQRDYSAQGLLAKQTGDTFEEIVDVSLCHYRALGLISWLPTYPKVKVIGKGQAVITGKAGPDRHVTLAGLGGRVCWLEIKAWKAEAQHTYDISPVTHDDRHNQYLLMMEESQANALAFYLVCWRWKGEERWVLHPVASLRLRDYKLIFEREQGLAVEAPQGWPDWLGTVLKVRSNGRSR